MASSPKKSRTEEVKKNWCEAIYNICHYINETGVTFTPFKIVCCNAFLSYGPSFSKAYCDTEPYEARLMFGDLFHEGLSILRDFELTKKVPTDKKKTLLVFDKLMDFLNGGKKKMMKFIFSIL